MKKLFLLILYILMCFLGASCQRIVNTNQIDTYSGSGEISEEKSIGGDSESNSLDTILPVDQAVFDLSNSNNIAPEDVIQELSYSPSGGAILCDDIYDIPTITDEPSDLELLQVSNIVSCGWLQDDALKGTIEYPDGKNIASDVISFDAGESYAGVISLQPKLTDPEGVYTFKISGSNGTVQSKVNYHKPDGPRMIWLGNNLILYGFSRNEDIRLFYYERDYQNFYFNFVGWQQYKTDEEGNLTIDVSSMPGADGEFAVVGISSGEVHMIYGSNASSRMSDLKRILRNP